MRTTVDIEVPLLLEIKELQKKEGRSLSKIVSELLAEALAHRRTSPKPPRLAWISQPMQALIDLSDKDAVYEVLDRDDR